MSDILEIVGKIKQGVESENWQLVCDAYNELTGEDIKPAQASLMDQLDALRKKVKVPKEICEPNFQPPRELKSNEYWDANEGKIKRKKKMKDIPNVPVSG